MAKENNIRQLRKDRGLSQEKLGDLLGGVSKVKVSRLENGRTQLTQEWLYRLAGALECHWTEIIDDDPVTPEEKRLLEKLRCLSENQRGAVENMVDAFGFETKQEGFRGPDDD